MKRSIFGFGLVIFFVIAISSLALANQFIFSTDRLSYTGKVTVYDSLEDANQGLNPRSGPHFIPNRQVDGQYNTPHRDVSLYFVNGVGGDWEDYSIIMTSWYYTLLDGYGPYSGWGNPNNTNTGFLQIYDYLSKTIDDIDGRFTCLSGDYFDCFRLFARGSDADYDTAFSRSWHAPNIGGAGILTMGVFHEYQIEVTLFGLEGTYDPESGWIEANNHPTGISGCFFAIFENTNSIDPSLNGFYTIEYQFGMDNWAFGNREDLAGEFYLSYFASPDAGTKAAIDIKPGSDENPINWNSKGVIPIAIMGSWSVDVTMIDPVSIDMEGLGCKLDGKGAPIYSLEDVNGDKLIDLVAKIQNEPGYFKNYNEAEMTVSASYYGGGFLVWGSDYVKIIP